jgi:hypothetical protein
MNSTSPNSPLAQRTATWTFICSVLTPRLVASLLSVSERTVGRYRDDARSAEAPEQERANALQLILETLDAPTPVDARAFFTAKDECLDGQTPAQVLANGSWTTKSPDYAAVIGAAASTRLDRRNEQQGLTSPLQYSRPQTSRARRRELRRQAGALTPHAASEALGAEAADDAIDQTVALTSDRMALRAPLGLDALPLPPVRGISPIPVGSGVELSLDLDGLGLSVQRQDA